MNTVVLAHTERTVVIDPGVLPSELDDLARRAGGDAVTLVFTHGDWDHVLGRPWWPTARTLGHDRLAAELRAQADAIAGEAARAAERHGERWTKGFAPFAPDDAVSGLHFTKLGPWRVVFRDAYGHSASMLSLHLPEHRLLIAADMLSSHEPPIVTQTCGLYTHTLAELALLARNGAIETIVPGHGDPAHGRDAVTSRIERDLGYLEALSTAAREAVAKGEPAEAMARRLPAERFAADYDAASLAEFHPASLEAAHREAMAATGTRSAAARRRPAG